MDEVDDQAHASLLARWFPPDLADWVGHGWGRFGRLLTPDGG